MYIRDPDEILTLTPDDFTSPDPLPPWVRADSRWEKQLEIVSRVYRSFVEKDVVFLQAPTGTGKTLIADLVSRVLGTAANYTCTTKALQDQFSRDFGYARVVKGKSNYLTMSGVLDDFGNPSKKMYSSITCADCTYSAEEGCRWCTGTGDGKPQECPYVLARDMAKAGRLAVLNSSYLLTDFRYAGNFVDRGLVVVDECDLMEGELLNNYEVVIGPRKMAEMGLYPPKHKTVEKSWVQWVGEVAIPTVEEYLRHLPKPNTATINVRDIREYRSTVELLDKLKVLGSELGDGGWVYDGYSKDHPRPSDSIIFRPVRVSKWGKELLWPYGEKWLLMSATILSADVMAEELGCDKSWDLIDVGSDFPVESRVIYPVPIADMSFKNREYGWLEMIDGVEGVIKRHPTDRVLVHCVSYELAKYLADRVSVSGRELVTYGNSGEKVAALERYKKIKGSVLFAASMDRGIDLPDDLCRVQIIAKIPFPNIKDKRINARLHSGASGSLWYRMQTVRTLIQMCGRGVRSKNDWAVTYILDKQFQDNLWKTNFLFPAWWKEAVRWNMSKGRLLYGNG